MSSPGGQVFMLECSSCGAKITQSGTTVGGHDSCNPHKYGPISTIGSPKQRRPIVYPTDAERNWLRIIDQNKKENERHSNKFRYDVLALNKLKTTAMQEITAMIKILRCKLDDRQDELERELTDAFEKRRDKMNDNIKALQEHKSKNEETKDNSEDLLADGDKPEQEREKIIVAACQKIIKNTPRLKYIETELRYTFDQLHSIERKISQFGILVSKPIDSGIRCVFKSTSDATKAPSPAANAKQIHVPIIQLKNSTFDVKKEKVKLSFKVIQKTENHGINIDIMEFLQIRIHCAQDVDDEKLSDDLTTIHEETLPFNRCKMHPNGKKYEVYVNKAFTPGITVAFKIKPLFESPDKEKYASCEGKYSREQTYEIPEEDNKEIFKLSFNGKTRMLALENNDVALTNLAPFVSAFLAAFGVTLEDNERLQLTTSDGILHEKSKLAHYATDSYVIRGEIIYVHVHVSPPPKAAYTAPAKAVPVFPVNKKRHGGGRVAGGGNGGRVATPKQISTIVVFGDVKKRVVLKNNAKKNVYEYTMDTLRSKLSKKFAAKGLKGHFSLKTDNGQSIEIDQHIIQHLAEYKGEIQVTQQ